MADAEENEAGAWNFMTAAGTSAAKPYLDNAALMREAADEIEHLELRLSTEDSGPR